ncbi:ABC transporter permease [Paenibacillus sp. FSL K6-2524]|uniref:ABC transporter permease n=1 Tax=Paenibacillus sp. FSL K6-2524 TaxID=2954516 RepID=UPI0030FBA8D2
MGPFFKKDLLILWRERYDTLVMTIIFLIMIIILGYTTSSWVEKKNESLQMTVAIVNEDNEPSGLIAFKNAIASSSLTSEAQASLGLQAEQRLPAKSLIQILDSIDFVKSIPMDQDAAMQALKNKEITAMINIPAGFTLATLNKILLDDGEGGGKITLTADQRGSMSVDVLQDVVNEFMQQVNLQTAIDHALVTKVDQYSKTDQTLTLGGREQIAGIEPLGSFQYYTFAISIIASLILAQTVALKAITEKREHVFNRILVTGSHPARYLFGKAGSIFCVTFVQFALLIVASQFIFDLFPNRSIKFWFGMVFILVLYSLCVAALTMLFTSLTFRIKESAATGILTLIIMVIGCAGGSFTPIYILPDWIKYVGEWTPNGLSLSIFISWIQHDNLASLTVPFLRLGLLCIVMIVMSSLLFPRRGRI